MTLILAILAAVAAVAVLVFMLRIAPGRTESVPKDRKRPDGQGEELTPRDRAA
jgi:hypothetical protein